MLTTVFGNAMREAAGGGKAWISSMTKRAAPGATIDIPLAHKDALYVRSHYDGITITLHDAPLPDEIAIIAAFANRGRLNHRVGGLAAARYQRGRRTCLASGARRHCSTAIVNIGDDRQRRLAAAVCEGDTIIC